jgi:hypothetical protein
MSKVPDNVNRPIVLWVHVNRQVSLTSTVYIYSPYGCIKPQNPRVYESTHKGPRTVVRPIAAEAYVIISCTSFCIYLVI